MYDWSYDRFMEDAKLYRATPMKGVNCRRNASDREQFMTWFKNCARDFSQEWFKTHEHPYDKYDGYIGDAFMSEFSDMCFSDYYKDTYNQRPHLARWYYVQALDIYMPTSEDVARKFCASPVNDAIADAIWVREEMDRRARELGW